MAPKWNKFFLGDPDGDFETSSSALDAQTRSPIKIVAYMRLQFEHDPTVPAAAPGYANSVENLLYTLFKEDVATTADIFCSAYQIANVNFDTKELKLLPVSALFEIGVMTFAGLCTGGFRSNSFKCKPDTTVGAGGDRTDATSQVAFEHYVGEMLKHEFNISTDEANRLVAVLIADALPTNDSTGVAINAVDQPNTLLSALTGAAGGNPPPAVRRSKSLGLGETTAVKVSDFLEAFSDETQKMAQVAKQAGHVAIIAAAYRISGAKLSTLWGIEEISEGSSSKKPTTTRRGKGNQKKELYADKHLVNLTQGERYHEWFPLAQTGDATNGSRVLASLLGGSTLNKQVAGNSYVFLPCGCSLGQVVEDSIRKLKGVKFTIRAQGPTLYASGDTIGSIRAQAIVHYGLKFGDADLPIVNAPDGSVVRPLIVCNSDWTPAEDKLDNDPLRTGPRPARGNGFRRHCGHSFVGAVRGMQRGTILCGPYQASMSHGFANALGPTTHVTMTRLANELTGVVGEPYGGFVSLFGGDGKYRGGMDLQDLDAAASQLATMEKFLNRRQVITETRVFEDVMPDPEVETRAILIQKRLSGPAVPIFLDTNSLAYKTNPTRALSDATSMEAKRIKTQAIEDTKHGIVEMVKMTAAVKKVMTDTKANGGMEIAEADCTPSLVAESANFAANIFSQVGNATQNVRAIEVD